MPWYSWNVKQKIKGMKKKIPSVKFPTSYVNFLKIIYVCFFAKSILCAIREIKFEGAEIITHKTSLLPDKARALEPKINSS